VNSGSRSFLLNALYEPQSATILRYMDPKLKSHFLNIYCMILADGKVERREVNQMYQLAKKHYDLQPEELNQLIVSGDITFYKPEKEEERIAYLYDLALVAVSDGEISATERILLEKYAMKFDVSEEYVTSLVECLLEYAKKGLSQSDVLKEFND
jgi:uncharacterized tellurite resistance protein B-like protein